MVTILKDLEVVNLSKPKINEIQAGHIFYNAYFIAPVIFRFCRQPF